MTEGHEVEVPAAKVLPMKRWYLTDAPFLARIGMALELFAVTLALTLLMEREVATTSRVPSAIQIAGLATFLVSVCLSWAAGWRLCRSSESIVDAYGRRPFRLLVITIFAWGLPFAGLIAASRVPAPGRAYLAAFIVILGVLVVSRSRSGNRFVR